MQMSCQLRVEDYEDEFVIVFFYSFHSQQQKAYKNSKSREKLKERHSRQSDRRTDTTSATCWSTDAVGRQQNEQKFREKLPSKSNASVEFS